LRRLEVTGLVQAQAPSGPAGESARHRRVYEPTQTGRAAHGRWLRVPVEGATVGRDLGLHLMRFVMMERVLTPAEVVAFLRGLADALAAFIDQLQRYAPAATDSEERHPRLALGHGLAVHQASLQWVRTTIEELSAPG